MRKNSYNIWRIIRYWKCIYLKNPFLPRALLIIMKDELECVMLLTTKCSYIITFILYVLIRNRLSRLRFPRRISRSFAEMLLLMKLGFSFVVILKRMSVILLYGKYLEEVGFEETKKNKQTRSALYEYRVFHRERKIL